MCNVLPVLQHASEKNVNLCYDVYLFRVKIGSHPNVNREVVRYECFLMTIPVYI